jgi:putative flippase GtrA
MVDLAKQLLKKHRELVAYGIVGVLSVADNIFWFWVFANILKLPHMTANALGWFVDVWITFLMNKYFVFESRAKGSFWKEAVSFIAARLGSGLIDMLLLFILADVLLLNVALAKGIDVVAVIILNYVTSKLWVFRKK